MPQSATTQTFATYLSTGYWQDVGAVPHEWDTGGDPITVNLTGLNADGKVLARAALDAWETVADLSFKEVTGSADIGFDDAKGGATTSVKFTTGGDTLSATINIGTSWLDKYGTGVGSYSFHTYMHEIGHALGLGHGGDYDGGAKYGSDAKFQNDSWQQSIMSYFNQDENTQVHASYAVAVTPMMADVLAIQQLYGKPKGGATAGDTKYGVGSDSGTYVDEVFAGKKGSLAKNALTLYDEGGTDTLDLSTDGRAQSVDLAPGAISDVYGLKGNLAIVPGTTIEHFTAGSGSDKVRGNEAQNRLTGNGGNDSLEGRGGNDHLKGGGGDDTLKGGKGDDKAYGGDGRDWIDGETDDDALYGEGGRDTLYGSAGDDALDGGADDDVLSGGDGADRLLGGDGKDVLKGDGGNDTLTGGKGADEFRFTAGRDVVTDFRDDEDTIQIDNALWGNRSLSVDQVLDMARASGGQVVFDFGDGHRLQVNGLADVDALRDDLAFV